MVTKLTQWSQANFAKLPWRQNRTLYTTLVSEIMLQQTTVGTVINHFDRFIAEYPDYKAVADATEEQLTISWKGLGYYRRARNLKKACQTISDLKHVPEQREQLVSIPGIGDYTAGAILAIGMDLPFLAIDGNLERVIARLYGLTTPAGPNLKKEILTKFQAGLICQEIYEVGGRAYNEALMDLGRNFCKSQTIACDLCPLRQKCMAYQKGITKALPVKIKTNTKSHRLVLLRVLLQDNDQLFAYQKKSDEWLSGQWEVPTYILETEDVSLKQYPWLANREEFSLLPSYKTLITKYRIENRVLALSQSEAKKIGIELPAGNWMPLTGKEQNFTTATLKALEI